MVQGALVGCRGNAPTSGGQKLKGCLLHFMPKKYPIFCHFGGSQRRTKRSGKKAQQTHIIYPSNFLNRFRQILRMTPEAAGKNLRNPHLRSFGGPGGRGEERGGGYQEGQLSPISLSPQSQRWCCREGSLSHQTDSSSPRVAMVTLGAASVVSHLQPVEDGAAVDHGAGQLREPPQVTLEQLLHLLQHTGQRHRSTHRSNTQVKEVNTQVKDTGKHTQVKEVNTQVKDTGKHTQVKDTGKHTHRSKTQVNTHRSKTQVNTHTGQRHR